MCVGANRDSTGNKWDFKGINGVGKKKVIRGKELNYLLIEGSIKQKEYNNYKHLLPNNRPLKHMKQKLTELKSEIVL